MEIFDAADDVNQEVQERAVTFMREALAKGCNKDDAHAACWLAGIPWRLVDPEAKPQRRAA